MEGMQTEVLKTSGVVEAVAPHDGGRYSVKVGGEWYGGFGTCPAEKGSVYVIDYALNGRFRNIKKIREIGEAVADGLQGQIDAPGQQDGVNGLAAVPIAVKNYLTPTGWHQTAITAQDEDMIQNEVRKRNARIVAESIEDARTILGKSGVNSAVTPESVRELALCLSETRIVHISKVYEQFLKAKIRAERESMGPESRQAVMDLEEA